MKRTVCILLFVLCGITSRAAAAPITFLGEGKVGIVGITSGLGTNLLVYAGELEWAWANDPGSFFYTYCVDANHWATFTQDVEVKPSSELTTASAPDAGGKAAWLINSFAPWVHSYGSGNDAAALQVAVWTALYDIGSTLNSGPFKVQANAYVTAKAQEYLTALYSAPGGGYYTSSAMWLDAPDGYGQDQMPIPAVPEPASLLLLGSGLFWAAAKTRRWGNSSAT